MPTHSYSPEELRDFVIAAHANLTKVQELLDRFPEMLNAPHPWAEDDFETGIQAAAHMGNVPIAEFLLSCGAPLEICTAAMLGREQEVIRLLAEDPDRINARGAHAIPLMAHAALSGNVGLARMLHEHGAREGVTFALSLAVTQGHLEMARWLLENDTPDLSWTDFQGKTPLQIATDAGNQDLAALLLRHSTI